MIRWLKEPFFHFLLIGVGLFLLHGVTTAPSKKEEKNIEITTADVDRIVLLWEKRRKRPPTQKELDELIDKRIHEEVLYREALAMGLDKDDPIIRQLLAQKVEYISNDFITINTPEDNVLQNYLNVHSSKYKLPGKISFKQIYFKPVKHDASIKREAKQLLRELNQENNDLNISTLGDNFLYGTNFVNRREYEIKRLFGKVFTKEIFKLEKGKWMGPLESDCGLHIVYIDNKSVSRVAPLERVRESVLQNWISDERKKAKHAYIENLTKQYVIKISKPTSKILPKKSSK